MMFTNIFQDVYQAERRIMKAIFRACGDTEEIDYPSLTKEEIYQEFIEWLLEKADASIDIEAEDEGGDV